jgi:isopropylmalate/homocitrate/citramalate synthase
MEMVLKGVSFDDLEKARKRYLERVRKLSTPKFDPGKWDELRKTVYDSRKLDVDVIIDDTTLREGLQMAGLTSPRPADACKIACLLRDIGVERLEVLTYARSDQEAIRMMEDEGLGGMLAAWSRAARKDVDLALELDFEQVGISHPVSYIHFEKWPSTPLQQLVERVVDAVQYAKDHGLTVFVHGEDSTRADWEFEKVFINSVAEAGASVYRICDTVGCGLSDPQAPLPQGVPAKVRQMKRETKIPYVEIHAHDDLGGAIENTMATIRAASGLYDKVYVSTSFLGIAERSGMAETEKIIMSCYMQYGVDKWNLKPLRELTEFLTSSTNFRLPANKAIVGNESFAHESGIHVHGVSILPLSYEPFPPELVGQERKIVIGKRSGKHGVRLKLEKALGRKIDEEDPRFIQLLDTIRKKFAKGRRRLRVSDEEFKRYARKAGFKVPN